MRLTRLQPGRLGPRAILSGLRKTRESRSLAEGEMPARWSHAAGSGTIGSCLECAHLAASPGGSGPDMEREGGRVRASRENSRTQRGAHCTALTLRRRPSGPASPRAGREPPCARQPAPQLASQPDPTPSLPALRTLAAPSGYRR
ncbi:unnamed protein product [Rangifer tarandus platyrhynchus]|uniref:Uncharacterized protein n=2 Tax=Rangifer tarandus platyrhynchus TaxID=3082113 RepID=A0ACB0FNS2_RANTA|nr:unnamed protein product [Rangifer tarandus platyrhynchus]CAI9714258.1 unnamed protein product [Rangifer tarandus platyrhynchus]